MITIKHPSPWEGLVRLIMAIVKPFRGIRPPKELVEKVESRPYDVLDSEEARAEAGDNEMSLYHIIKPEINFEPGTSEYDPRITVGSFRMTRSSIISMLRLLIFLLMAVRRRPSTVLLSAHIQATMKRALSRSMSLHVVTRKRIV